MEKDELEKATTTANLLLTEVGYNGLSISSGQVYEEIKRELIFPRSVVTYKQMAYDSAVSSALNYYEHMMLKAKFTFRPHAKATEEQEEYASFMLDIVTGKHLNR